MKIISFSIPENKKISPLDMFGHKIQEIVMPIVAIEGEKIIILGTGFVINPDGIIITAKHVISDYLSSNNQDIKKEIKKEFSIFALYISKKKHGPENQLYSGGFLPLKIAWYTEQLDITFCWLQRPIINGFPLNLSTIALSPGIPKVGEKLLAFGYYKSTAIFYKEKFRIDFSQETGLTHGAIIEVHNDYRDRSFLSFPCFQTDALFKSGMSGGPVFNEKGAVCGVICSSIETEEDENCISYASLVWPSLATPITVNFKTGNSLQKIRIYELIEKGLIPVDETFSKVGLDTSDKKITKVLFHQ